VAPVQPWTGATVPAPAGGATACLR
jgi:hypothetical protein